MAEAKPQVMEWERDQDYADKDRADAKDLKKAAHIHVLAAKLRAKVIRLKTLLPVIENKFNRKMAAHKAKIERLHEVCKDLEAAKLAQIRDLEEQIRSLEREAAGYER